MARARRAAAAWGAEAIEALAAIAPGQVAVVCGMPGTGKGRVAQAASLRWARTRVFDPVGWSDREAHAAGEKQRGMWSGVLVTPAQLFDRPWLMRQPSRLVVSPRTGIATPARVFAASVEGFLMLALAEGGRIVVVLEELALYGRLAFRAKTDDRIVSVPEAILRATAGGAHAPRGGLSVVLVCQSMGRVPKDARRHVGIVVAGAQAEPTDLDDLQKRCGPEFARRVRALKAPDPSRGIVADPPLVWRAGDLGAEVRSS